ncbi:MAG: DNA mismatch repair endonuclease MutL [Nitrospirota bacterium]|nr:DNA mismatch repair endonuclease MutL [Nitrospirota bacterium]
MPSAPRIRLLPDPLVDQIAAGEVVERPASVVKELLENALDSGATRIGIDVEHGGKRRIRISDDGGGIHPDDLPLAVTRHATSKIRSLDDLSAIRSLGFRGEALPSIASVSHLTITSTLAGSGEGCCLTVSGGSRPQVRPSPPVPGTTVDVVDLFYNTPARAKFLKGDTTEWGHIVEAVTETALGAPGVTFVLTHNGRPARRLEAVASFAERARQLCPEEVAEQLLPLQQTDATGAMALEGVISRPGFHRATREHQRLIVGGRPVRNATIGHAVYAACETALPGGRHPVFFLSLSLDPAQVDVNVHPAKREIRLAHGNAVHHFVREAVREALGGFRGNTLRLTRLPAADAPDASPTPGGGDWAERVRQAAVRSLSVAREPATLFAAPPRSLAAGAAMGTPAGTPAPSAGADTDATPFPPLLPDTAPARVLGQMQHTFILAEQGDHLRIVDQHTAHERVLFERLLARVERQGLPGQRLLVPIDMELPASAIARLQTHAADLARLGLEVEPFGSGAVVIRTVPEPLAGRDPRHLLTDLVDELAEQDSANAAGAASAALSGMLHRLLATVACHAAVKAGDPLTHPQMEQLLADLEQTANPHTCPHGRAVTAVLERGAIKGLFDRTWGR